MAKGGKSSGIGYALRGVLVCLVPLGAGVAGMPPGYVVTGLSILSALFEALLYAMRGSGGKGKAKRSLRPAGFFPLQLVLLYMLQLWCLMLYSASSEEVPGVAAAPADTGQLSSELEASRSQLRGAPVPGALAAKVAEAPRAQPLAADAGAGFVLDASPEVLQWTPHSISVVLPCAEEREYALKTVRSVFDGTPKDVLHEIIVVDDGSEPPLSSTHLKPEVQSQYRTKVLRHPKTVGLIGAKKTGGDAATGDIVVFFDCHVAPQVGWHEDFLRLISENYRRMVVPHITALNVDTWTQIGSGGGLAKCYLTWDADFKWVDSDDHYIPVISGGLLGMSRKWWQETGGYDTEMLGWGGENLDQSLRVWLCGGEIVMAPNAEVAHMWRDGSEKTSARYQMVGDTSRNRARAVYGWYGDFSRKLLHYPIFAQRQEGHAYGEPWYGDLATFQQVKSRLSGCRPFAWFLRRFRKIYEDGGLLPQEIFMLREEQSGRCLRYQADAGTSPTGHETAALAQCDENDHRFFWHLGNTDRKSGRCCSGLRAWNTDQCLEGGREGGKAGTGICVVNGQDLMQEWGLRDGGLLKRGSSCLGPGSAAGTLVEGSCLSFRGRGGARWTKMATHEPLETELYRQALREHPEAFKALDATTRAAASPGVRRA